MVVLSVSASVANAATGTATAISSRPRAIRRGSALTVGEISCRHLPGPRHEIDQAAIVSYPSAATLPRRRGNLVGAWV